MDDGSRVFADAHAFVIPAFDDPKRVVDLGVVQAGIQSLANSFNVSSSDVETLHFTKVLEAPSFVRADIAEDGASANIVVRPNAPWGQQYGYLKLATDAEIQPEIWVEVKADVRGKVVPSASPFDMGVMRTGSKHEFLIGLNQIEGKPFKTGKVRLEGIKGTAKAESCAGGKRDCRQVRVTISDNQPLGALKGKLLVDLPEYKQTLPVNLWGLLLSADTKIRDISELATEEGKNQADSAQGGQSPTAAPKLADALKKAVKPEAKLEELPGRGPLLRWQVANEQTVYGYAIYRSETEDGKFLRVNKEIVKKISEDGSGASYQWRDTSAEPGKTYWYQIGTIQNDGTRKPLSGPQRVIAK